MTQNENKRQRASSPLPERKRVMTGEPAAPQSQSSGTPRRPQQTVHQLHREVKGFLPEARAYMEGIEAKNLPPIALSFLNPLLRLKKRADIRGEVPDESLTSVNNTLQSYADILGLDMDELEALVCSVLDGWLTDLPLEDEGSDSRSVKDSPSTTAKSDFTAGPEPKSRRSSLASIPETLLPAVTANTAGVSSHGGPSLPAITVTFIDTQDAKSAAE